MLVGGELALSLPSLPPSLDSSTPPPLPTDSITLMHYAGISRLLDGISFAYRTRYKTNEKLFHQKILEEVIGNPLHSVITLNPAHPAAAELLEEAGVGAERLEVPVVSMLRNDFLGTTKEVLNRACEENGVSLLVVELFSRSFEAHHPCCAGRVQLGCQRYLPLRLYVLISLFIRPSRQSSPHLDASCSSLPDSTTGLATARNYTSKPSPYKTLLIVNTGFVLSPCFFQLSTSLLSKSDSLPVFQEYTSASPPSKIVTLPRTSS